MQMQAQKRTTVDIDTRRHVIVAAQARKPKEVAEVNHETFIRNAKEAGIPTVIFDSGLSFISQ